MNAIGIKLIKEISRKNSIFAFQRITISQLHSKLKNLNSNQNNIERLSQNFKLEIPSKTIIDNFRFSKFKISHKNFSTNNTKIENDDEIKSDNQTNSQQHEAKISINYGNIKGTKSGDSEHYIIMFTCKKCDHRTTRIFTKHSYHHGVVLIRCEGCDGVHLIADNLGWFDDGVSNIEQFLKAKGEEVKRMSVDGLFSFNKDT